MIKHRTNGKSRRPMVTVSVADAVARTRTRRWRRLILVNLLIGSVWQLTRIVVDLSSDGYIVPDVLLAAVAPIQILTWIALTFSLLGLGSLAKKDKAASTDVRDESRSKLWQTAIRAGFYSTLATQLILLLISPDTRLSAMTGADITIYVGVVSAIGTFLFLSSN